VLWALAAGYRHFDTAQIYQNEQYLGMALKTSGLRRNELFITSKIHLKNYPRRKLHLSTIDSLHKLQTDYIDLLLLHFPLPVLRKNAWLELEEVAKLGYARAIGVSNYTIRHLEQLKTYAHITPAVNQVELHVYLQQPELLAYCRENGILVEAYSPLAHGRGLDDPVLAEIGRKYGKSPTQVMLRWCIEQDTIPLPKSTHQDRIAQNIDIFDFKLDGGDMERLRSLNKNLRTCWSPVHVP
jgi:diketogulonate reductase-like aldo/keto reductase